LSEYFQKKNREKWKEFDDNSGECDERAAHFDQETEKERPSPWPAAKKQKKKRKRRKKLNKSPNQSETTYYSLI
jgi:hypothetical protein